MQKGRSDRTNGIALKSVHHVLGKYEVLAKWLNFGEEPFMRALFAIEFWCIGGIAVPFWLILFNKYRCLEVGNTGEIDGSYERFIQFLTKTHRQV